MSVALGFLLSPSCTTQGRHPQQRVGQGVTGATEQGAAVPSALQLGTFPAAQTQEELLRIAGSDHSRAAAIQLRVALKRAPTTGPLSSEVSDLLSRAAKALGESDGVTAGALANEAKRLAPDRVEPLEALLLASLSQGSLQQVRETLDQIAVLDEGNPIGVAFRGLDAVSRGRCDDAVAHLSWFVGVDALPRRGAATSLPMAAGELEEQGGLCALRLGYAAAALEFFDAALTARASDALAARRLALLQSDALVALGELDAAAVRLGPLLPTRDGISMLAQLRLDAIAGLRGDFGGRLERSLKDLLAAERSDFALSRVLFAADSATRSARAAASDAFAAKARAAGHRAELVRVMLRDGTESGARVHDQLAAILTAHMSDHYALRCTVRMIAQHDASSAVALAVELLAEHPNELEALTDALMGCGVDIDDLNALITSVGTAQECDALRSRMLAKLSMPEEALLLAETARARDATSACILAASALAAADLGDESILGEVDDAARTSGGRVARTLAECWLKFGDAERAKDRASMALSLDPLDAYARALSLGEPPVPQSDVDELLRCGHECDSLRLPIAFECYAQAHEIDPESNAIDRIAHGIGTVVQPSHLRDWISQVAAQSPALPKSRSLSLVLGKPAKVTEIPAYPLSARFDARCSASGLVRSLDNLQQTRTRPKTPEAIAALAHAELEVGDVAAALAIVVECARSTSTVLDSRAAQALLAVSREIVRADAASADRLRGVAALFVSKLTAATVVDMRAALELAEAARASSAEIEQLVLMLARSARRVEAGKLNEYFDLFEALEAREDDPFCAAQLAQALASEKRFDTAVRARFAASAVALYAAAGSASQSEELLHTLHEDGVDVFTRPGETEISLATTYLRAAEVHTLLGDAAGNEALLAAAVAADPSLPEALNNIAYLSLTRGAVDENLAAMVERAAAAAPDNPAVLDTLGFLRYHQGRFHDTAAGSGAITLYRQALRLRPNDPSLGTLDHLGDALWRDGLQQDAIHCWQQVGRIASLRYPPQPIAQSLIEYQRRVLGVRLADPVEYVRRLYGETVDGANRKLQEAAAGSAPSLPACAAIR